MLHHNQLTSNRWQRNFAQLSTWGNVFLLSSEEKLLLFLHLRGFVWCGFCVFHFLVRHFQVSVSISSKLPQSNVDIRRSFVRKNEKKKSINYDTNRSNKKKLFQIVIDSSNLESYRKWNIDFSFNVRSLDKWFILSTWNNCCT